MNIRGLKNVLQKHSNDLQSIGATSLYIFGSRAKEGARVDSDLDLFIDYESAVQIPSLLKLVAFERIVSIEVGIPVHVTTRRSLHPSMKSEIERTAIKVF